MFATQTPKLQLLRRTLLYLRFNGFQHPQTAIHPTGSMSTAENATNEKFEDEVVETGQRMLMFNVIPSWVISFIGHVGLIVLLAFLWIPPREELTTTFEASATPGESLEAIDLDMADFDESEMEELSETEFENESIVEVETMVELETLETLETAEFMGAEEMVFDEGDFGDFGAVTGSSDELGGRTGASKKKALKEYGGTDASEEAVQLAIKWIINHQLEDGGWNLDHRIGPGKHRNSPNPGKLTEARNAATALALLPLLGNGQTHKVGFYKDNIRAGLEFLMSNAKRQGRGISFFEPGGTMYSHGLCSIVFCEAFAMSKDPKLAPFAQGAIWFMEDAQDPVGGGWRYTAKPSPGDTSVVGWQIMALKSAKLSGLDINPRTTRLMDKFLTAVSNTSGSLYGYREAPTTRNRARRGQTSIGLLSRMYMGWEKDAPGLKEGVDWIATQMGPDLYEKDGDTVDIYYDYYGTQVMKQYGGPLWTKWNTKLRDSLVNSQSKDGDLAGSWFFNAPGKGRHISDKAGRLYTTALACMTLEVYYRYLPIYSDKSISDDFKLE